MRIPVRMWERRRGPNGHRHRPGDREADHIAADAVELAASIASRRVHSTASHPPAPGSAVEFTTHTGPPTSVAAAGACRTVAGAPATAKIVMTKATRPIDRICIARRSRGIHAAIAEDEIKLEGDGCLARMGAPH